MKRLGAVALLGACASAGAVDPAVDPAIVGGLSPDGPRARYEASLGAPPRTLAPGGALGHAWRGEPPYVAGASALSRGEFIHDDFVFDDTGADTSPDTTAAAGWETSLRGLCSALAAHRHGEYAYPAGAQYLKNSADLAELRIAATADSFHVLFQLQTLVDARTTAAVLEIEDVAGQSTRRLEIHGSAVDAAVATLDGAAVPAAVDLARNTFEARLPRAALPDGALRLAAATGTWNGAAIAAITDLAFVAENVTDELNCWSDRAQSAAIASGDWPRSPAVDPAALAAGANDAPQIARGAMVRLHAPSIDLGEGIVGQPKYGQDSAANLYRGKLQPYAAYVPESYDAAADNPLVVLLHCLDCNHLTFQLAAWPGLTQLADARGAIVVTPLAYGEGGHYEEEAEWDVFDVMADVASRYRIDRERIYLAGMSMGALGTFRLGSLYPDLWAAAMGYGIYTTPFCVTASPENGQCSVAPFNYLNFLPGFLNVPAGMVNGAQDELTPVSGAREIAARFAALGNPHRYWEYRDRQHEPRLPAITTDVMNPYIGDRRRVTQPARVRYAFQRSVENPGWGLTYTRAYWLSDLRPAESASIVDIDAKSGRGSSLQATAASGAGESAQAGPFTWQGLDDAWRSLTGESNALDLRLRGVAHVRVDLAAASLSAAAPLTVTVDSDVPVRIELGAGLVAIDAPAGTSTHVRGELPSGSGILLGAATPLLWMGLLLLAAARRFKLPA